jgi:hypothetical protein
VFLSSSASISLRGKSQEKAHWAQVKRRRMRAAGWLTDGSSLLYVDAWMARRRVPAWREMPTRTCRGLPGSAQAFL